ncbi:hypothetical protein [Paracoccus sp. MC1862]|nr:hypothetical protein [Paracoccus sp. MC1862]MBB1499222.1 hypothetical protein [Paracoccus sp. MC1862]
MTARVQREVVHLVVHKITDLSRELESVSLRERGTGPEGKRRWTGADQ